MSFLIVNKMEDASAQFVVMVIDKLQESEKLNSELLQRVQRVEFELKLHRQALPLDLHMRLNGTLDFSDGSWIIGSWGRQQF